MTFKDRKDAGIKLGQALKDIELDHPVVLALPRGGVPVGKEVADALNAPLDIILVRKVGDPANPEYALGAVAEGGVEMIDEQTIQLMGRSETEVSEAIKLAEQELDERSRRLRGSHEAVDFSNRNVILVDDGLATGSTMIAAARAAKIKGARKVTVAVPVSSHSAADKLTGEVDQVIALHAPIHFAAVGQWYDSFGQTPSEQVISILEGSSEPNRETAQQESITLVVGPGKEIVGDLALASNSLGLIIFAHGSGSSRHSPRNRMVADYLNRQGLSTLLIDLLTREEEGDRANVFDISLLGQRVVAVIDWAGRDERVKDDPIGLFGASTGAAAALSAASERPQVGAVVSRGGRPDLAGREALTNVQAPVLLIVGSRDLEVLQLNQMAAAELAGERQIAIVQGASHLFEEKGALEEVCHLASDWFIDQL